MAVTPKVLIPQSDIPNVLATVYTSPVSGTGTWIDFMTVTNYDTSARTFTIYVVPFGGATGSPTKVISARSIAAGASYACPEIVGRFLNAGDYIRWECSAGGTMNGGASGRELTAS